MLFELNIECMHVIRLITTGIWPA